MADKLKPEIKGTVEQGGSPLEDGTQIGAPEYAPDAEELSIAKAPAKLKPCPHHPKQTEAPIQLQGDLHWRCPWCHTVLD